MESLTMNWAGIFSAAFLSIVFLQSGFDKVINYKQELGWIQQKFVRNILYKYVGALFLLLTVFEVLSGLLTFFGVILLLAGQSGDLAFAGVSISVLTLLMLIFGQRITKDYTGSASLVPYFIAGVLALHFLS